MPRITIEFTGANATRIADAYGAVLNIDGAPATGPQVKAVLVENIKQVVRSQERAAAERAALDNGDDPEIV
jgi:hypothetical protein